MFLRPLRPGQLPPIKEAGIIAQINAEVLAGITLGQLVNPGTPCLYGSVPVRARLDTLGDSYGIRRNEPVQHRLCSDGSVL